MKLEVVDSARYSILKGMRIDSIYPVLDNEWHCITKDLILIVGYKAGIVTVGIGETELEAKDSISIIAKVPDLYRMRRKKLGVKSIIEFMQWEIDENNFID